MRIGALAELLGALPLVAGKAEVVASGYCSDLLSDVMAHAAAGSVLVTIQAHKNSVAVASLVGIAAILLCNGREAPPDMVEAAEAEGIGLLVTALSQFEASGRLWAALRAEEAGDGAAAGPSSRAG